MNTAIVRQATLNDLKILLEYEQGVIEAERPFDITIKKTSVAYYDIKAMIIADDTEVVVMEYDGQIVSCGYALIKPARHYLNHEKYAYLGFMYTHPDYRGHGLNARVIDVLKEWSLSRGLKEIRLTVYNDNIPAIKAYEKVGFEKHIIEMRLK